MIGATEPDRTNWQKPSQREELEDIRRDAEEDQDQIDWFRDLLRDSSGSVYLRGISQNTPFAAAPMESIQDYIQEFVVDAIGCDPSSDPLLRSLAEQVVLAYHTVGRLYNEAFEAQDPEYRRMNLQMAITLTGEFRRLTKDLIDRCENAGGRKLQVAELEETDSKKTRGRKQTA